MDGCTELTRPCGSQKEGRQGRRYLKGELKAIAKKCNIPSKNQTVEQLCTTLGKRQPPTPNSSRKKKEQKQKKQEEEDEEEEQEEANAMPLSKEVQKSLNICIKGIKGTLLPHQARVVEFMLKNPALLVIHQTGSGKTFSAIIAALCLMKQNPSAWANVVTSKTLLGDFKQQLNKFGVPKVYQDRFHLFTYEDFLKRFSTTPQEFRSLCSSKNTILILDEAHRVKEVPNADAYKRVRGRLSEMGKGKTTAAVLTCGARSWKRILLTATPVVNNVSELYPLLMLLSGNERPQWDKHTWETQLASGKLPALLQCKISFHMQTDSTVQRVGFPEQIDKEVRLEMTPEIYKVYRKIEKREGLDNLFPPQNDKEFSKMDSFYHTVRKAINADLTKLGPKSSTKTKKTTNSSNTNQGNPKVAYTIDSLEKHRNLKTIVYSSLLEYGVDILKRELNKRKLPFVELQGSTTAKQRDAAVKQYNEDKVKILLLTGAGRYGLNTKGTRRIILLDPDWANAYQRQVIARGVRYLGHAHLPVKEQNVTVERLLLVKPAKKYRDKDDTAESVDTIIDELSKTKETELRPVWKILKDASIENVNAECNKPANRRRKLKPVSIKKRKPVSKTQKMDPSKPTSQKSKTRR